MRDWLTRIWLALLEDHEPSAVSRSWLREQARQEKRRGVDQAMIRWPIRKAMNEGGIWQSLKLRRRA